MSYISEIQDTTPRVLNNFWQDLLQKKVGLVVQRWSNPVSRQLKRRSSKLQRIQCTIQKILFFGQRKMTPLSTNLSKTLFLPKSQTWFQKAGGQKFSDTDCLQRNSEGSKKVKFQYCINSQIFLIEKFVPFKDTLVGIWWRLSMLKNALSDTVNWQTRQWSNSTKYLLPCLDDHHLKEEELKFVGELSKYAHKLIRSACTWLVLVDLIFLWSVNKFVRAIKKWTRAWPRGWGHQGMGSTGGGGPARVPNLRVCKHFGPEWHTQGRKGEVTSCRGTV